jgi:two-component system LytT family response regulator
MIRALLIEDEQASREDLAQLLEGFITQIDVVGTASDVDEALQLTKELRPDLVFLDIHLGNQSGFDFLQKFESIPFEIIFTTAFDQYAINAFEFGAFQYLLKPIQSSALQKAIDKLSKIKRDQQIAERVELMLSGQFDRFTVPTQNGHRVIDLKEVLYLRGDVNYSDFYFEGGKKTKVSQTLKHYQKLFAGKGFFRIHKSNLINLRHVKGYSKGTGGYATMSDGKKLEIAQAKKKEFVARLQSGQFL